MKALLFHSEIRNKPGLFGLFENGTKSLMKKTGILLLDFDEERHLTEPQNTT
ncbi:MAG: hypothetical protein AAFY76_20575 [Cyanobacteria bacterium J06649_11]